MKDKELVTRSFLIKPGKRAPEKLYEVYDEDAIAELKDRYSIEEMHAAGITCNRILANEKSWLECLEEIDY